MLVLEAMAKDLDKDINILKCAVPYFKYAEKKEIGYLEHEPKLSAWFLFLFSYLNLMAHHKHINSLIKLSEIIEINFR